MIMQIRIPRSWTSERLPYLVSSSWLTWLVSGSAQQISGLPQECPLGRAALSTGPGPPSGLSPLSAGPAPSPACRPTSPEWCRATCLWMPGSSSNACRQHRHRTPSPPPGHRDAAGTSLALTNREKAWKAPQASALPRLQGGPAQARRGPRPAPTHLPAGGRALLPARRGPLSAAPRRARPGRRHLAQHHLRLSAGKRPLSSGSSRCSSVPRKRSDSAGRRAGAAVPAPETARPRAGG